MGGLIGMAQTLAVYHYGYYTLKNRTVQDHGRQFPPFDAAAVLDWGLDTPFTFQDKPPLAIAMIVSLNGERSLRRYRLVIVQKARIQLSSQVTAALTSHSRDHRLTASGFFPCSIDREYLYGYAADGYRSPLWLCAAYNGLPVLAHRQRATTLYFHQALTDRKIIAIPGFEHLGNLGISITYHNFSTSIVACIDNLIHEIPIGYSIISPQLTIGFEHRLVRLQVRQFP